MPLNPLSPECCHCHTSSVHFLSFFSVFSLIFTQSLCPDPSPPRVMEDTAGKVSFFSLQITFNHLQLFLFFSFLNLCSFNLSSFMRLSNLFFFFYNGLFLPFLDYYLLFLLHPSHQSPVDYPNFII